MVVCILCCIRTSCSLADENYCLSILSQPVNSDVVDRAEEWVRDGAASSSCIMGEVYSSSWYLVLSLPAAGFLLLMCYPSLQIRSYPSLFVSFSNPSRPYPHPPSLCSYPLHLHYFSTFSFRSSINLVSSRRPLVSSCFVSLPLLIPVFAPFPTRSIRFDLLLPQTTCATMQRARDRWRC